MAVMNLFDDYDCDCDCRCHSLSSSSLGSVAGIGTGIEQIVMVMLEQVGIVVIDEVVQLLTFLFNINKY